MLQVVIGVMIDQLKRKRRAHFLESLLARQRETAGEHHVILVMKVPPACQHRRALNAPGKHLAHGRVRHLRANGDQPSAEAAQQCLRLLAAQRVIGNQSAETVGDDDVRFEIRDLCRELGAHLDA